MVIESVSVLRWSRAASYLLVICTAVNVLRITNCKTSLLGSLVFPSPEEGETRERKGKERDPGNEGGNCSAN